MVWTIYQVITSSSKIFQNTDHLWQEVPRSGGGVLPRTCTSGKDWARIRMPADLRPQTPTICWPTTDTQPRSMWYRGPGIPKSWRASDGHTWKAHGGPPRTCLPWASVPFWSAPLCTMAGYVMVSLLLCSFRTTDRPVLDMRTVVRRERKKPNNVKSKIRYKWTYLGNKNKLTDLEKRPVVAKGEGR